ncbi:MAG: hypothetical protein KDK78_11555, partial [Chlamydiia bacterium]|nr:hypothetical protein [Chlamydiia bacterium]
MELLAAITQDCIEICRASYYECELGKDPIQHLNVLENGRLEYTPKKTGILNLSRKSRETEVLKAVDAVRQRWEACSKSEQKQIHSDVAAHLSARDGMTFNRIISPGTLISRITFCSNFRFSNTEHQRDALIARASALHQVCKDVVGVEKAAIRELEQLDLWPLESLDTVSPKALEARIERLKRRLSCLLAQPQHAQKMVAIPFKFEYADILKTAWMDYLSAHQGIPLFQLRFGPGGSSPQSSSSPCSLYALWQCMAKLPILKELDLNGMPINDGVFRTLEQLLAKHQLRSLRIAQLDPDEIDVCELCDLLTELKSLEVLVLDLSKFILS